MTHINRVLTLYSRLKHGACTINQLDETTVSSRQIYRDLKEVARLAETLGETLMQESDGRYNRKIWFIRPNVDRLPLPADDLDTYYIGRAVLPNVFTKQRATSLDRMQEAVRQRIVNSPALKYKVGLSEAIVNSHFYENRVTDELDVKLKEMLWAVSQQFSIRITDLAGDSTSVGQLITLPVDVYPINVIFHRGCFYVATIRPTDQGIPD